MVGCVLVKDLETDPRVIGVGHHGRVGGPHAEPTAIAACTSSPFGAAAIVTLEPCCHLNKRTPPCVPALIRAGVSHVVVGAVDPNPDVNGQGLQQLRAAGIRVTTGVLSDSCNQLIAPFIAGTVHRRPYVTLKWAQSADGKIAGAFGRRQQISGLESTNAVHELRSRSDGILVGGATVRNDNPQLTARVARPLRQPKRFVLTRQSLPAGSHLADIAAGTATLSFPDGPQSTLRSRMLQMLRDIHFQGVTHLLIEPGPNLASLFLQAGAWDRAWVITSSRALNDSSAPNAPPLPANPVAVTSMGNDALVEFLNTQSEVYFANEPSADFLLATGNLQAQSI